MVLVCRLSQPHWFRIFASVSRSTGLRKSMKACWASCCLRGRKKHNCPVSTKLHSFIKQYWESVAICALSRDNVLHRSVGDDRPICYQMFQIPNFCCRNLIAARFFTYLWGKGHISYRQHLRFNVVNVINKLLSKCYLQSNKESTGRVGF